MDPQTVIDFDTAPLSASGASSTAPTDSIQFSVSRQSVMRIGVPCVPVSKRTKRVG